MATVSTGRALGSRYQLVDRLGGGAMGEVWRALDLTSGAHVAAKLLRGEFTGDPEIVGRFVQERSLLLTLEHPHIVRVRDMVVEGDDLAIVMDLVEGSDLRQRLKESGTLAPAEAVRIAADVLRALAFAHEHNCLHRDVKPDNVLLGAGDPATVLLSDFGIARLAQETTVKVTGALGTPEYMAPEVFVAEQISAAADVYGVGIMLYELLAGRTPFAGGTNGYAVVNRHVTAAPPPIEGVTPSLWSVLSAMLAKDPARRPSAESAARQLAAISQEVAALPAIPQQRQPDAWDVVQGVQASEFGVRGGAGLPASVDVGRTNVRGGAAPAPELPTADGDLAALTPVGAAALLGETNVGAPRVAHQAPTLIPDVVAAAPGSHRTRNLLIAGGTAVVVAVASVVLLTATGHHSKAGGAATAAAADTLQAQASDSPLSTGLTITRQAVYDAKKHSLTTTVTWQAGKSPLSGPFYESLPLKAGDCAPVWSDSRVTDNMVPGLGGCSYAADMGTLAATSSATASYTVDVTLKDQGAVTDFLDAEKTATTSELAKLSGAAYAVQRLEGVDLDVPDLVTASGPLGVRVLPVWVGAHSGDAQNPLFDSSAIGSGTGLLDSVAGGITGLRLDAAGCGNAFYVDRHLYPIVTHPGDNCELDARVGELEQATALFTIDYK